MFPVAYALCTNKRQDLYVRVLQKIVEVATAVNGTPPNPNLAVSDFEMGLMQALEQVFPGARARGCMFHYGQVGSLLLFFIYIVFI